MQEKINRHIKWLCVSQCVTHAAMCYNLTMCYTCNNVYNLTMLQYDTMCYNATCVTHAARCYNVLQSHTCSNVLQCVTI